MQKSSDSRQEPSEESDFREEDVIIDYQQVPPIFQSSFMMGQLNSNVYDSQVPEVDASIILKKDVFEPSYLEIEKGQIVEWIYDSPAQNSPDFFTGRSHVISFDNLNAESNLLTRNSESFKVRFLETGSYTYRCQIYTRMRGVIEVRDRRPKIPVVKSVKELGRLINQAAIPQAKGPSDRVVSPVSPIIRKRKPEPEEERKKSGSGSGGGAVSATSDLSLRLLQVLDEEGDLRISSQGNKQRQNYYKEILESKRASSTLISYGAELQLTSNSEEDGQATEDQEEAEKDE